MCASHRPPPPTNATAVAISGTGGGLHRHVVTDPSRAAASPSDPAGHAGQLTFRTKERVVSRYSFRPFSVRQARTTENLREKDSAAADERQLFPDPGPAGGLFSSPLPCVRAALWRLSACSLSALSFAASVLVYSTESTVSSCDTIVYFMNFDVWGVESHPQGSRI